MKRIKWKMRNLSFINFIVSVLKNPPKIEYHYDKKYSISTGENIVGEMQPSLFLLIKPIGMKHEDTIIKLLNKNGVTITRILEISDYRSLAYHVFDNVKAEEMEYWFYILDTQYDQSINNKAKLLLLNNTNSHELNIIKRKVRKKIGIDFYKMRINGVWQETSLTPVHSPDENQLAKEFNNIMRFAK